MILWLAIACVEVAKNPLAVDDDAMATRNLMGIVMMRIPPLRFGWNDGDCDGVLSADDCDDTMILPLPLKAKMMQIVMA